MYRPAPGTPVESRTPLLGGTPSGTPCQREGVLWVASMQTKPPLMPPLGNGCWGGKSLPEKQMQGCAAQALPLHGIV
jgi:hypothetical protein